MSLVFEDVRDLDLDLTLDCGQCFRWKKAENGHWRGVVRGRCAEVYRDGDSLVIIGAEECDRDLWRDYFDLGIDYGEVLRALGEVHPVMAEATRYAPGIRILAQEPWEVLITFIISQNNNIKRIAGIIDRLSEHFGEELGEGMYSFPTCKRLALCEPEDLSPIRAGFRHRYIIDAARKVESGEIDLDSLRELPYEEAQKALTTITGVGVKVADCVMLYGLHRLDGFPMDVWMKRAMKELFDDMDPARFGEYAGIAQQTIFHYARMHGELFEK